MATSLCNITRRIRSAKCELLTGIEHYINEKVIRKEEV